MHKIFLNLIGLLLIMLISCEQDGGEEDLSSLDSDLVCKEAPACIVKCQKIFSKEEHEAQCEKHSIGKVKDMEDAKRALSLGKLVDLEEVPVTGFLNYFEIDTDYFFEDLIQDQYNNENLGAVLIWLSKEADVVELLEKEDSDTLGVIKSLLLNLNNSLDTKLSQCKDDGAFPSLPSGVEGSMRLIYSNFHGSNQEFCDECIDGDSSLICAFRSDASLSSRFRVYKGEQEVLILPSSIISNSSQSSPRSLAPLVHLDFGSKEDVELYLALSNRLKILDGENILNFSLKQTNVPFLEILLEFLGFDSENGICDRVRRSAHGEMIAAPRTEEQLCKKAYLCFLTNGDEDHGLWDFLKKYPKYANQKHADSLRTRVSDPEDCDLEDLE